MSNPEKSNFEQHRSKLESFESIKYFTYWITVKRVFNNIQIERQNGYYHIIDKTDIAYKYTLGSGLTIDQAIEQAYTNSEVVKRLNKQTNNR